MPTACPYCGSIGESTKSLRAHITQKKFCRQKDEQAFYESDSDPEAPMDWTPTTEPDSENNSENDIGYFQPTSSHCSSTLPVSIEEIEDDPSNEAKSVYGNVNNYVYAMPYPGPAGMSLHDSCMPTSFEAAYQRQTEAKLPPWTPFKSEQEWELARWLISSGASQKKIDKFCMLDMIRDRIEPSFHNSRSLLQLVDSLESGPAFQCTPIRIEGDLKDANGNLQTEMVELWHRDPVDIVKELMGNIEFRGKQQYAPVQHYRDAEMMNREYSEMWTCNWWWNVQKKIPNEYGTVTPVIIASDQTQLSTFSGDKKAWPVYLSIGNIEKNIRRKPSSRAFLLLGYLPVSKLECFSKNQRSQVAHQLFHDCMKKMLEPLESAGRNGVKMMCADGFERLAYLLLAAYMADYPEQCLICCCKENSCPRCTVKPEERGQLLYNISRSPTLTLIALEAQSQGEKPEEFQSLNLRPINPFWRDLPHCNIFECITPDLLHQLHKGVFGDHVAKWAKSAMGRQTLAEKEIDRRFRTMTAHPNLRHFSKGISSVSQWTGNEYRAMSKVYPGIVAGAVDERVVHAVTAVEDFMHYAHFEVHTDQSLAAMDAAWSTFHEKKNVFLELGLRTHFNISKLHNVSHYSESIRSRGTNDGFNTESSERLHIDLAKSGYRASNKRNFQPQMTRWLTRQEAIHQRVQYMGWVMPEYRRKVEEEDMRGERKDKEVDDIDNGDGNDDGNDTENGPKSKLHVTFAKHAPLPRTSVHDIETKFNCGEWFLWYLREFLENQLIPTGPLKDSSSLHFPVWKKAVLTLPCIVEAQNENASDTVYATMEIPELITPSGVKPRSAARTSTVVVRTGENTRKGPLNDITAARVRLLFKLPLEMAPSSPLLAFVDWFTPFQKYNTVLQMYQLSYATRQRVQHSGIILASSIQQTCHLMPEFGRIGANILWDSTTVLDRCPKFYVNPYLRHRDFLLFRYDPYLYSISEAAQDLEASVEIESNQRPRKRKRS
ncbi:hypothetical protein D9757_014080 [Collybiopsis confluens]|uniref:Transposase n=1 Tax=Collybiopsis confluens TaxID=2823264 RepID=A0A8H5GDM9_9AGAR|nr:hypothetical protein D9757_014080 [Collybiopsis confluens]